MTWEPHGVRTRFVGPVTAADLLHHVREVCSHPDFGDLRFSILDFREAVDEVNDAELIDVKMLLMGAQLYNSKILVAAITVDPGAIGHLTRFIRMGVLNRQIQVFASPEAAMEWIAEQSAFLLQ